MVIPDFSCPVRWLLSDATHFKIGLWKPKSLLIKNQIQLPICSRLAVSFKILLKMHMYSTMVIADTSANSIFRTKRVKSVKNVTYSQLTGWYSLPKDTSRLIFVTINRKIETVICKLKWTSMKMRIFMWHTSILLSGAHLNYKILQIVKKIYFLYMYYHWECNCVQTESASGNHFTFMFCNTWLNSLNSVKLI